MFVHEKKARINQNLAFRDQLIREYKDLYEEYESLYEKAKASVNNSEHYLKCVSALLDSAQARLAPHKERALVESFACYAHENDVRLGCLGDFVCLVSYDKGKVDTLVRFIVRCEVDGLDEVSIKYPNSMVYSNDPDQIKEFFDSFRK